MNIIQHILKLPLLVKIIIIVAIYFMFFRKENFGKVDVEEFLKRRHKASEAKRAQMLKRSTLQKKDKGMMGQLRGLFKEKKKKDAISKSKLFKKLFIALSDKGYNEDVSWEKAYAITKKQIENLKKKKMMKKKKKMSDKEIEMRQALVKKYMKQGFDRGKAKVMAKNELSKKMMEKELKITRIPMIQEMTKRELNEERDEDFLQFKKKAEEKNKIVKLDPRIGKFMNEFMMDNEGAPESEGLEYAKEQVRKIINKESEVKKKNLNFEKAALLKAQQAQQKALKQAQEARKKEEIAKREAEKKAREAAKKAQKAKEAAIKKALQQAKRDKEKMEAAKQRELLKAQKAQQKVLKEAEEAKKKALRAKEEAEKKIIEAKTENIKAKIEEKNAELAKIEETEVKAKRAVKKAKRAKSKAIKKAKEAEKAVDKAKKATKEAILKEKRTILPPGTKKGQVLKWDGTKWTLGTDNIF